MPTGYPYSLMPSFYIDKRLCPCCLGARRLGGEPCEECGGTGVAKDGPVLAQRSAPVGGETLPHLGDPFPADKETPCEPR